MFLPRRSLSSFLLFSLLSPSPSLPPPSKVLLEQGHNLQDNDLIRHNLVVFRNGENALQVRELVGNYSHSVFLAKSVNTDYMNYGVLTLYLTPFALNFTVLFLLLLLHLLLRPQVLPPLMEFVPEARLNLVIYYLRNDEIQEAFDLVKDLEPTTPQE